MLIRFDRVRPQRSIRQLAEISSDVKMGLPTHRGLLFFLILIAIYHSVADADVLLGQGID